MGYRTKICCTSAEVDVVTNNWIDDRPGWAGIDQRLDQVGSAAIDMLIGLLQRGECGIPEVPYTQMVAGRLVAGKVSSAKGA